MATLAFVLAAFLDPIQAGIVLAVLYLHRGPRTIMVAAAVAALASETIIFLFADAYEWGELIAPRLVSSLMQAALLYWTVRAIRRAASAVRLPQPREWRLSLPLPRRLGDMQAEIQRKLPG